MAIVLIGLVVTALATVTAAVTADVRRTGQLGTDAQFRQLLLAGAADATAHAKVWGDAPESQSWAIALPEELTERGFRVQVTVLPPGGPAKADAVEVRVDAGNALTSRGQVLSFKRSGGQWTLWGCAGIDE